MIYLMLLLTLIPETNMPTGMEVAQAVDNREVGQVRTTHLRMTIRNKRGQERVREVRTFQRYFGKEKRSVLVFDAPKSVKDTAFLTHDFPDADRDDDQWLYLPALKKVRRISASDRGDYFLGTDFTYEDMKNESGLELGDFHRKNLGLVEINGVQAYHLEELPVNDEIALELGVSRREVWIDPSTWMPVKVESWDRKGNHLRTVTISEIRQVQGIWTAHRFHAINHKTGHQTTYEFSQVDYSQDLDENTFNKNNLRRGL